MNAPSGIAPLIVVAAGIGTAAEELEAQYQAFSDDFAELFPELQAHCDSFIAAG